MTHDALAHECFPFRALEVGVLHIPGQAPADTASRIGQVVVVGDTLVMHGYGATRSDFSDGDAYQLWRSTQQLSALSPEMRLWMWDDFKVPGGDRFAWESAAAEQRSSNSYVEKDKIEDDFLGFRTARDTTLAEPARLPKSTQFDICAGQFPSAEASSFRYLVILVEAKNPAL